MIDATKPKGLCIATRCRTIDEFVARFHPFCDDTSIFVATLSGREVGVESQFVIMLRNKTPVMRGWCVVFDSWSDANNPFGRPGIRLGLHRLSAGSQVVFSRMQAARKSGSAPAVVPSASAPTLARSRCPTVEAVPHDFRAARQLTVRIPAIGRDTAPLRGIEVAAEIAVVPPVDTARPRLEIVRDKPARAMTAPLRGERELVRDKPARPFRGKRESSGVVTSELDGATDRMAVPLLFPIVDERAPTERELPRELAVGSSPVPLAPQHHYAVRQVTAAGMIEPRTPGSRLVLPANPLMNLTDESLGGFVDCRLDELLGTTPEPREPAPSAAVARGSSDRLTPVVDDAPAVETPETPAAAEVVALPAPPPRRFPWLFAICATIVALALGFGVTYVVAMQLNPPHAVSVR